jgi:hypothetical protein
MKTVLNTRKKNYERPDNISSSSSSSSSEEIQGNPFKHNFDINEPFISKLSPETRKLYILCLIYHSALKFSGVKLKKFMGYFQEDTFGNVYLSNVEVYDLELEGEIVQEVEKKLNFKEDMERIVKEFGETPCGEDIFQVETDRLRDDFGTKSENEEDQENQPTFFEKI